MQTIILRTAMSLLACSTTLRADSPRSSFPDVSAACEGRYRYHLQGICTDDRAAIFWCFTDALVKTNAQGKVLRKVAVGNHHGDLCHLDGKIFVAVNFGPFNDPAGKAESWVYVYDADDLSLTSKHKAPELVYGAGGIATDGKHFFVVGGLPEEKRENYVYEYDPEFRFVKKHVISSGYTRLGIQTATYENGHFWFGCYGKELLTTDAKFALTGRYDFDCGIGVVSLGKQRFLVARGSCVKDVGCTGRVLPAKPDKKQGLSLKPKP